MRGRDDDGDNFGAFQPPEDKLLWIWICIIINIVAIEYGRGDDDDYDDNTSWGYDEQFSYIVTDAINIFTPLHFVKCAFWRFDVSMFLQDRFVSIWKS